jgi:hypothetical protein
MTSYQVMIQQISGKIANEGQFAVTNCPYCNGEIRVFVRGDTGGGPGLFQERGYQYTISGCRQAPPREELDWQLIPATEAHADR